VADTIQVTYKVSEDGSLKAIGRDADKAAKSTNKVTNATSQHNKAQKGVIGATSNSTKAFSKMTTGITGGLVPAYATLAANVFALTALFGALSKAASLRLLEDGLLRVGNAAGQNLAHVSQGLRDITDAAVSTETAMRATALAFSSGFSGEQLTDLTKVAKGASLALGRDMTDALDRLVRGTAKLEPEILDELGIMVRLDDAVETYAATLGKTGGELTQYERRMAFLNATIEQGGKKFGDLAANAEVNPYDKLAAAFADLTKVGVNLLNTVIEPFVNYFSSNPIALTGAVGYFASSLVKQLVPAISASADAARGMAMKTGRQAAKMAEKTTQAFKKSAKSVSSFKYAPKSLQTFEAGLRNGTVSAKGLKDAIKTLQASEDRRQKNLDAGHLKNMKQKEAEIAQIRVLKGELQSLSTQQGAMGAAGGALGKAKGMSSTSRKTAAAFKMMEGKNPLQQFKIAGASIKKQTKDIGKASGALNKLTVAFGVAGNGAKLFGTALLNAIPIVGQILMAVSILWPLLSKLFAKGAVAKAADEAAESFSSFNDIAVQLEQTLERLSTKEEKYMAVLRAEVGVIQQVIDGAKSMKTAGEEDHQKKVTEQVAKRIEYESKIRIERKKTADFNAALAAGELTWYEKLFEIGKGKDETGPSMDRYKDGIEKATTEITKLNAEREKFDKSAGKTLIAGAITNLVGSGLSESFTAETTKGLEDLYDKLETGEIASEEALSGAVESILGNKKAIVEAVDAAAGAQSAFNAEVNKLAKKNKSPFEPMTKGLQTLVNEYDKAIEGGEETATAYLNNAPEFKALLDNWKDSGKEITDENGKQLKGHKALLQQIKNNNMIMVTSKSIVKEKTALHKLIGKFTKGNGDALKVQLEVEEEIRKEKIKALEAEMQNFDLMKMTDDQLERRRQIKSELLKLAHEERSEDERTQMIEIERIKHSQKLLGFKQKIAAAQKTTAENALKVQALEAKAAKQKQGKKFTTLDQKALHFDKDNEEARKKIIEDQYNLAMERIDLEFKLLKAQTTLQKARAENIGKEMQLAAKQELTRVSTDRSATTAQIKAAQAEVARANAAADTGVYDEILGQIPEMRTAAEKAAGSQRTTAIAQDSAKGTDLTIGAGQEAATAAGTGDTTVDRLQAFSEAGGFSTLTDGLNETSAAVATFAAQKDMMQPMIDQLASLGPDGAIAGAIVEGSANIQTAVLNMADTMAEMPAMASPMGEKALEMGAKLQVAAAAATMLQQTLAANSQAKIASIDEEIAAEQRRDGQSAASVAKIKAMEAKKEAIAKKAFNQQKKMQMAQVVIATASSVAHNVAAASAAAAASGLAAPAVFTGVLGALNAVTIGLGAAQLAIISSTSFKGGGGGTPSAGGATSISAGKRENTVDLAKANNASGELAYAREAKGTGNMTNFKPAFSGHKHRQAGGYVVGEQGPELFMPEVPGNIIPAGQGMGGTTNVNFSISAVDATGVQELLEVQKGNIIGMIRQAANEHGESFLEMVKEDAL